MVGGTHEVDRGATLQRDELEDLTLAHQRDIAPIPVLDLDPGRSGLGLIPRRCPDPIPDLSHHEGGLQLLQMMEILKEEDLCLGHLRGSDPSLLEHAMEALVARGLLLLGKTTDSCTQLSGTCL